MTHASFFLVSINKRQWPSQDFGQMLSERRFLLPYQTSTAARVKVTVDIPLARGIQIPSNREFP